MEVLEAPKKKRNWVPLIVALSLLLACCVCAVPAALVGLLVPAVQRVREAAARTQTMNNMSQVAKAAHLAHDKNKKFPPYAGPYDDVKGVLLTFHTHLLPYLDQMALYKAITQGRGGNIPGGWQNAVIPPYISTMDPSLHSGGAGACNFPVNLRLYYTFGGNGTLSPPNNPLYPKMPNSFPDGTSNTLLLATKYMVCGTGGSLWADPQVNTPTSPTAASFGASMAKWQAAPTQAQCNPLQGTAVSFGPQNIQVALCDASVRTVTVNISPATWAAVHTPGAGDILGADWDN
jgi:hypothetical protein